MSNPNLNFNIDGSQRSSAFAPSNTLPRTPNNHDYNCKSCWEPDHVCDMVQCDSCDDWHHLQCVGVSPGVSTREWKCNKCIAKDIPSEANLEANNTENPALSIPSDTSSGAVSTNNEDARTALVDEMNRLKLEKRKKHAQSYNQRRQDLVKTAKAQCNERERRVQDRHSTSPITSPRGVSFHSVGLPSVSNLFTTPSTMNLTISGNSPTVTANSTEGGISSANFLQTSQNKIREWDPLSTKRVNPLAISNATLPITSSLPYVIQHIPYNTPVCTSLAHNIVTTTQAYPSHIKWPMPLHTFNEGFPYVSTVTTAPHHNPIMDRIAQTTITSIGHTISHIVNNADGPPAHHSMRNFPNLANRSQPAPERSRPDRNRHVRPNTAFSDDSSDTDSDPELTPRQLAARKQFSKDFPSFSGLPRDWPQFYSELKRSTKKCALTNDEVLGRLKRCLTGEALQTVSNMLRYPKMVPKIIETLKDSFGKPHMILKDLITDIRKYPPLRMDKLDVLMKFANDVQNLTATMEASNLTKHLQNPMLWVELAERLPLTLNYEWSKYRSNVKDEHVDLEMFSNWMEETVKVLSCMKSQAQMPTTNENKREKQSSKAFVNTHVESPDSDTSDSPKLGIAQHSNVPKPTERKRLCRICQNTCPNFKSCEAFKKLTPSQRMHAVKEHHLCPKCVKYHRGRRCLKYGVCGVNQCVERHDPILHGYEESTEDPKSTTSTQVTVATQVLLHKNQLPSIIFRIVPVVIRGPNTVVETFAFFDEGSSITLLEESLAKELELTGICEPLCIKWTGDTRRYEDSSMKVSLRISGTETYHQVFDIIDARTINSLNLPQQTISESLTKKFEHLDGLPIQPYTNVTPRILIGMDNWRLGIPLRCVEGRVDEPFATKTRLGWCLSGPYNSNQSKEHYSFHVCRCQQGDADLHQLVKDYFSVESLGIKESKDPVMSIEDKRAMETLRNTTKRVGDHFETGLLWRYDTIHLPDSYSMAFKRWECLNRKMAKNTAFAETLCTQMKDYIAKGYARKIRKDDFDSHQRIWYLPIFAVINANKPGKTRLVWDAAAETKNVSLNSVLLKGPDLLNSLIGVLFRFRERNIGLCADIKEMFHQIRIRTVDQDVQRFLWGKDEFDQPEIYKMQVMTFGASCSPSSAQYVMRQNANEFRELFPTAVRAIETNHYVDDLLVSVNGEEEALQLAKEIKLVHAKGGFLIRNWISNSEYVTNAMGEGASCTKNLADGQGHEIEKVLGMWWCTNTDTFTYRVSRNKKFTSVLDPSYRPTKREVLKIVMMLFDPLGLMSHFLTFPKVLLQNMWRKEMKWDDQLDEELLEKWRMWTKLLPSIEDLHIPRCYFVDSHEMSLCNVQLHTFVDASEQASAAVCYLRIEHNGNVTARIVSSKTRVAPLKSLTIPRLELEAAVIGSRLAKTIRSSHSFRIDRQVFWSDSKTVLCWLKSDRVRFRQFVSFRISEILENSESFEWRYVPSKENVADEGTKWTKPIGISLENRWFRGPPYLLQSEEFWPEDLDYKTNSTEEEVRQNHHHQIHEIEDRRQVPGIIDVNKFSKWKYLVRGVAASLRYMATLRASAQKSEKPLLTTDENYRQSELIIIRQTQLESFHKEISCLTRTNTSPKSSNLFDRNCSIYDKQPFLDGNRILRAWGRIDAAYDVEYDTRHPIILPRNHYVTKLIILHYHEKCLHHHNQTVLNELKQKYVFARMRSTVQSVIRSCPKCSVKKAKPVQPLMSDLPAARIDQRARPFENIGIDFFGPMHVTVLRSTAKRWGVLVTCLVTRAVHIEIAHSLSTDSCILSLSNFMLKKGVPKVIYSDNGTNFKGAADELKCQIKQLDQRQLQRKFTTATTKWVFNPPASPHMGGCWERLIRSVKVVLSEVRPSRQPTDEVLCNMMAEAENMLNSRPLTYVPLESPGDEALTPNHFLRMRWSSEDTSDFLVDNSVDLEGLALRKKYIAVKLYTSRIFKRWVQEYLTDLTRRTKWHQPCQPIAEGDIVIICDPDLPKNTWLKGRVIEAIPGKNNQVRAVSIQTTKGNILKRPACKVAVLDVLRSNPEAQEPSRNTGGDYVAAKTLSP